MADYKGVNIKKLRKYRCNHNYFNKIDSEEKVYWLGFISADGYLNTKHSVLRIMLSKRDKDHLKLFLKAIQSNHQIKDTTYKGFWYSQIRISSKDLVRDLLQYVKFDGIKKSSSLKFPKNIPDKLIRHYIRGYFDGDGHIINEKKHKEFGITSNKYFLVGMKKKLMEELGGHNTKNKIMPNGITETITYQGKFQVSKIKKYLYWNSNIYLKRNKNIFDTFSNDMIDRANIDQLKDISLITHRKTVSLPPTVLEKLQANKGDCIRFILNNTKIVMQKQNVADGEKIEK